MLNSLMFENTNIRRWSTYNLFVYVNSTVMSFPQHLCYSVAHFIIFFKVLFSPSSYNVFSEARWDSSAL